MKNNREHVLKVATKLISERGFDGASTREIAQRAKVSQGMINYYFGSKEALLKEIISDFSKQINTVVTELKHSEKEGLDFLKSALLKFFKVSFENRDLSRIMNVEETMDLRDEVISQNDEVSKIVSDLFISNILDGKAKGIYNEDCDEELVVTFLVNALNDYIIRSERIIIKQPIKGVSAYSDHHQKRVLEFSYSYLEKMLLP
ncbi:TetR/AcrR family transcriptional regulator [Flammeovirga kamogawensis]|uniref:TetR/AcrR family transcriptional regulator n=1 Tax=Flammeovirga kamogawensis TaxID=373891 RepID=A0ABX8GZQ0_9BACT|nr:TetR/AcrR family transcriptional regulator [Flammeovirga kamogawensis]MBB6459537.1 AcrR family transcriptional regulator [Flammeovirga kamogawensis]QWG09088.1 TetR/AcrR family transcriptional regulator [Flammeovirga kamogawensis]TRX67376.1 TetR/AcrR family transcriptional regulator [Flammeovirga kamogawensis]